ncbi:hemolysin III family protein [bacterium]|nr:hemolysin III family protein [bacterium]
MTVIQPYRPLMRGYIHLVAAIASPFALLLLLLSAHSARAYVGAAIFGASIVLLFSTSATYHLLPPWPRMKAVLRRVDHATIFVAVAGLYTPFCLQALGLAWGISLLSVVGALALAGAILKLTWPDAPSWLNLACYLSVGWVGIVAAFELPRVLSGAAVALMLLSGALYSVGGACFAARWPHPNARVFGHHELFHLCVVAATAVLYVVVMVDVLPR